jgi:hypothetical protein
VRDILKQAIRREMAGEDATKVVEISRVHAVPPTVERLDKIEAGAVAVEKVADYPSAAWRMVPAVEQLAIQRRVTPNMLNAAQLYVTLRYLSDGPSAGIGRYDSHQEASPSWSRTNTTDERMKASKMFKGARLAAFGTMDKSGQWVLDESLIQAIEPLLLGDAERSWTMEKVGGFLGSYRKRDTKSACGVTELTAVLRRLRLFFKFGEDG